jgi:hypothetical protein
MPEKERGGAVAWSRPVSRRIKTTSDRFLGITARVRLDRACDRSGGKPRSRGYQRVTGAVSVVSSILVSEQFDRMLQSKGKLIGVRHF